MCTLSVLLKTCLHSSLTVPKHLAQSKNNEIMKMLDDINIWGKDLRIIIIKITRVGILNHQCRKYVRKLSTNKARS